MKSKDGDGWGTRVGQYIKEKVTLENKQGKTMNIITTGVWGCLEAIMQVPGNH